MNRNTFLIVSLFLFPAANADICRVPLKIVNIENVQNIPMPTGPAYKIGINVGLGGGAPRLYEFDTGGPGFWAAWDWKLPETSQWWGRRKVISRNSISVKYTSGNQYTANLVETDVALFDPTETSAEFPICSTGKKVQMAQIVKFNYAPDNPPPNIDPTQVTRAWKRRLKNGKGPLFNHFWGDFGAALHPTTSSSGSPEIYTVLNQFQTGAKHNGFIVHVGNMVYPYAQAPYVQIGLDQGDIDSFPYQFPMNPECPPSGPSETGCATWSAFSNRPVNTFAEAQFNADVTLNGTTPALSSFLPNMGIIIDSGATYSNIFQNPNCTENCLVHRAFIDGPVKISTSPPIYTGNFINRYGATISGTTQNNTDFSSTLKETSYPLNSYVAAAYSADKAAVGTGGTMNTGILWYSKWDVMYDITAGVIGFRPSVR